MRIVVELGRFLARLAIGIAVALLIAVVLALVREGSSFQDSFRIACYVTGVIVLFMSLAGHSPTMRLGVHDPFLTSFFPKLLPQLAKPYSGSTLSSSAVYFLTGIALLGIGLVLS